jgi:amino acid permease
MFHVFWIDYDVKKDVKSKRLIQLGYIGAKFRYFFWFFYVFSSFFRLNFQKFLKIMKLERN